MNENENTTTPNLWDSVKSSAKGNVHSNKNFKKQEENQINNLTLYLKQLEKEEMKNLRVRGRKEIVKIRADKEKRRL